MAQTITVIPGDGIGPEVTDATLTVLKAAGADLEYDMQQAGLIALQEQRNPLPKSTLESAEAMVRAFTRTMAPSRCASPAALVCRCASPVVTTPRTAEASPSAIGQGAGVGRTCGRAGARSWRWRRRGQVAAGASECV